MLGLFWGQGYATPRGSRPQAACSKQHCMSPSVVKAAIDPLVTEKAVDSSEMGCDQGCENPLSWQVTGAGAMEQCHRCKACTLP
jgi:hypothetical protein